MTDNQLILFIVTCVVLAFLGFTAIYSAFKKLFSSYQRRHKPIGNNNAVLDAIDPFTRGAFTGWKGYTNDSTITLDEAEEHFSQCMTDMMNTGRLAAQNCSGGCRFEPRYNTASINPEQVDALSRLAAVVDIDSDIVELCTTRNYVCDVCIKCGKIVR